MKKFNTFAAFKINMLVKTFSSVRVRMMLGLSFFSWITLPAQTDEEAGIGQSFDSVRVYSLHSNRLQLNSANTGGNWQIVQRAELLQMPVQTTAELLSYVLGADLRQRGPMGVQADIQIQGSTFDQVLVLIDGVRMSDPQTGHHQMNLSVPLEAIERIEIIKGAAARRYGLNALAGVVNIITRSPEKRTTTVSAHQGFSGKQDKTGQYYRNQAYRIFNAFASEDVQGWFSLDADMGNGYRNNSDFQAFRSNVRVVQRVDLKSMKLENALKIQYSGGMLRNSFGANGFYAPPADSNAYEHVHTQYGAVTAELSTLKAGVITARLSGRGNQDEYIFIRNNPAYYRNFHRSTVINPELSYRVSLRFLDIALGAEYRKEMLSSTNLGDHSREFLGTYADLMVRPLSWLRVSGGAYVLQHRHFGTRVYPGADVNAHLGAGVYAFASAGNGQRLPTFTDLYYKGPGNLGNPDLLPEQALYYDAGVRRQGKRLGFQFSVFRRENSRLIDRIRDSATGPWHPVNHQSMRVSGLESRISYRMKLKPLTAGGGAFGLRLSTGLTALEANGISTAYISQFAVSYLPLQWISSAELQQRSFSAAMHLRYIERFGLESGQRSAYTLIDFRVAYTPLIAGRRRLSLWSTVQNLGNTSYREFAMLPLLPRWITAGLQAKF